MTSGGCHDESQSRVENAGALRRTNRNYTNHADSLAWLLTCYLGTRDSYAVD